MGFKAGAVLCKSREPALHFQECLKRSFLYFPFSFKSLPSFGEMRERNSSIQKDSWELAEMSGSFFGGGQDDWVDYF